MASVPESRLKCIGEAQSLSRYVLVSSLLLSITFLIAAYNSFASWDRLLLLNWEEKELANPVKEKDLFKSLKEKNVEKWLERRSFQIASLGIHFGIHDVVPISSMVFPTVALWTYFTIRRERLVYERLRDEFVAEEERKEIFTYIADHSVFFRLAPNGKTGLLPFLIPFLVTFAPWVTFAIVFLLDALSLCMDDLFEDGKAWMWSNLDFRMKCWLSIVYPFALLVLVTCTRRCILAKHEFILAERICNSFAPTPLESDNPT